MKLHEVPDLHGRFYFRFYAVEVTGNNSLLPSPTGTSISNRAVLLPYFCI